jgi:hypothetical protein
MSLKVGSPKYKTWIRTARCRSVSRGQVFTFLGTCNIRLTQAAVHNTYLQIRLHKLRSVVVELADFDVLITAARRRERETVVDEREVDLLTHNVREFGQAPCLGMHHAPGAAAESKSHIFMSRCYSATNISSSKQKKTHFFLASCRKQKHVILEQSIPQPRLEQASGSTETNTVRCLHQLPS